MRIRRGYDSVSPGSSPSWGLGARSCGQGLFLSEQLLRELSDRKRAFYAAVAESVPRGEHRVLEDAAHSTIHIHRPDAVLQAIRDLLDRVDR